MKLRTLLNTTAAAGAASMLAGNAAIAEQDVSAAKDGEWVHLSGDVVYTADERLGVDYGGGSIVVELDDQDAFDEAARIDAGDRITVRGRVDQDFAERKSIEADTIFVHEDGVLYRTSYADDEPDADFAMISYGYAHPMSPDDGATMSLSGTIAEIEDDDTFLLDVGGYRVTIDADEIEYRPLSTVGVAPSVKRIELQEGDRIRVTGEVDGDLFAEGELEAYSLVRLKDMPRNQSG